MNRERLYYWKNKEDMTEEEIKSNLYITRETDSARYYFYRWYRTVKGEDMTKVPLNAECLNDMEEWYLDLAQEAIGREINHQKIVRSLIPSAFKDKKGENQ